MENVHLAESEFYVCQVQINEILTSDRVKQEICVTSWIMVKFYITFEKHANRNILSKVHLHTSE